MTKIGPSDRFKFGMRLTTLFDEIANIELQEKPASIDTPVKYSVDVYETPKGMHSLSFELSKEDFEQLRGKIIEHRRSPG